MVTSIATRKHRDRRDEQDLPGRASTSTTSSAIPSAPTVGPAARRQASRTVTPRDDPPMTEPHRRPRLSAVRRGGARVTNLELFFDLVFVLAVTQCTASIEHDPSWTGVSEALAVLALLWWAWGGYAWLTSLIDPEEGPVRLLMFGAMAATVVASLCVPDVFGDLGADVRARLRRAARRPPRALRRRGAGDAASCGGRSPALAVEHRDRPRACWSWPSFTDGWVPRRAVAVGAAARHRRPVRASASTAGRLQPEHFAERFGLFVLIALGESVVAIGAGAEGDIDGRASSSPPSLGVALARRAVVDLLRRRQHDRRRAPGRDPARQAAERPRPRRLGVPALPDDRRHRARRLRARVDAGPRRRSARRDPGASPCSAARRCTCSPTSASACAVMGTLSVQRTVAALAAAGAAARRPRVPALAAAAITVAVCGRSSATRRGATTSSADRVRHARRSLRRQCAR